MRIAVVAPYQGPTLARRRPIDSNLSLGARTKLEVIAQLLHEDSHSVEILSQGEVVERQLRYFPGFAGSESIGAGIPISYASAVPVRFVNGLWSSLSTLRLFKARHRVCRYDLLFIYNLKLPQVACARYALDRLGLPVILEYEDDHFLDTSSVSGSRLTSNIGLREAERLLEDLAGCVAGSSDLLSQVPGVIPQLLLPGVVGDAIVKGLPQSPRRNWVVFSGTHSSYQGLEQLVKAWAKLTVPHWELHIAGHGAVTSELRRLAADDRSIIFHGVLDQKQNAALLASGKITVVPYEVSKTRGFSFKTVECLAAGLHVITTRLSALDSLAPELKPGLTYLEDNAPETIAATIQKVITEGLDRRTVRDAAISRYGPAAASRLLHDFLEQVMLFHERNRKRGVAGAGD
jgi:glycosyltransferase involved in cell wall biosynthesis